jgi:outer membrane protein assembly factor BamB
VGSLQGFVQGQAAPLRLGPSNVYTVVTTLNPDTKVTVLGRNPSGEWLYICCAENQQNQAPTWVRQAYVRPRDNQLQSGAPEGSNPNDVRWLAIQPAPSYLPLIPTPVPPGADDYPFYRYDRHGQGRVDQLPLPPLGEAWPADATAGGALSSPVAVMGSSVLVGSADNHLYSFERQTGSQRWRFNLCQDGCTQINQAPMVYENEIFIIDQNRTVWAMNDQGGPNVLWRVRLDQSALTSFNIYSETLFLATGEGASHTLLALDRDNGAVLWRKDTTGPTLRYPIIGDQLVYAADSFIAAYDVITGELVWENRNVQNIMAGPVYGSPGPSSVAELYLVTGDNRIFALDANTGVELWNMDNGEAATSLALNENALFVAGDSYVKAISRQDRNQRWRTPVIGGMVMGGPLVDATRVLVVTQAGNVHLLDNESGSANSVPSIAASAGGAPAVSGPYIFIPGVDGRLYELLGSQ